MRRTKVTGSCLLVALTVLGMGCTNTVSDTVDDGTDSGESGVDEETDSDESGNTPEPVYFEDDFSSENLKKWNYNGCTSTPHVLSDVTADYTLDENGNIDIVDGQVMAGEHARQGQCGYEKQKLKFRVAPFDYRGGSGVNELRQRKGGAEIAIPSLTSDYYPAKGTDIKGETYQKLGNTVVYGYKFSITDTSMLRFVPEGTSSNYEYQVANYFEIFQQLSVTNVQCRPGVASGVDPDPSYIDDFENLSPSLSLVLRSTNSGLAWEFRTKTPYHPYYDWTNGTTRKCNNENPDVALSDATCFLPLWTAPFDPKTDLGREVTVAVRYTLQQQKRALPEEGSSCAYAALNDVDLSQAERAAAYEACRPSKGRVEVFFDGRPVKGNTQTGLPWINGHDVFEGVSTQFNLCPSYPKMGVYAKQYKYDTWQQLWEDMEDGVLPMPTSLEDVPMIGVDYSGFRIGGDLESVMLDW